MDQWSQNHGSLSDSLITDPRPRSDVTIGVLVQCLLLRECHLNPKAGVINAEK